MTKKAIYNGLALTGAVVGVGFASGREVYTFFARFGYWSLLFCLLAGILFGLLCYLINRIGCYENLNKSSLKNRKNAYNECKKPLQNGNLSKTNNFSKIFNIVLFVCQIAICSAMFAGIASAMKQLNLSNLCLFFIKLAMLLFCLFYLLKFKGVYKINALLSVLMIIVVIIVFALSLNKFEYHNFKVNFKFGYLPLLYVGMNIFTAYPLIYEQGKYTYSKKQALISSIVFGLSMCLALSLVCVCLIATNGGASEMPILNLARSCGTIIYIIYYILIVLCIITTCLSTAFGAGLCLTKMSYTLKVVLCLLLGFAFSFIGFAEIIDKIYPFIGFVCLIVVFLKLIIIYKNAKTAL